MDLWEGLVAGPDSLRFLAPPGLLSQPRRNDELV
jgi:hypothetical protein